jgi:hypothetical protein
MDLWSTKLHENYIDAVILSGAGRGTMLPAQSKDLLLGLSPPMISGTPL